MKIIFTTHAYERMHEFGLTKKQAIHEIKQSFFVRKHKRTSTKPDEANIYQFETREYVIVDKIDRRLVITIYDLRLKYPANYL